MSGQELDDLASALRRLAELEAAAIEALDEVEGWPHGPHFIPKRETYDAALARLRTLAQEPTT